MRVFIIALATGLFGGGDHGPEPDFGTALAAVTGAGIRAHMAVLADDGMQGREAGTAGFQAAAEYVARQYSIAGLEPLGDDGGYFQSIEFFETRLVEGSAKLILERDGKEIALAFGEEFLLSGSFGEVQEAVTARLVFVGFGIRAPEYGHDDFAGLDVSGKILVEFSGAPPRFATDQRAYYSSSLGKKALAVRLGAVGILSIRTPADQQRMPWSRYLAAADSPAMHWLERDGRAHEGFAELIGSANLSEAGAQRLFEMAGQDLDALFEKHVAGGTGSFDLGVGATVTRVSAQRGTASPNVLGLLRGSDPALRDQLVLYTAHLDHLGLRPGPGEDRIHNGAYDNAAGVAALLEIARSMAAMRTAPRRSILFAALTGEEKGLQGSDYLAHHPPLPAGVIVANINIDMPYLGFPIADIKAFGAEHSSLQGSLLAATARLGLTLTPDSRPELVRFIRSDQFSFVRRGIPGLNLKPGSKSSDPGIDGDAMLREFLTEHYHGPSDDLSLPYDPEGARRFVQTALLLGLLVAADDAPPRWNPGDFFGELFASANSP